MVCGRGVLMADWDRRVIGSGCVTSCVFERLWGFVMAADKMDQCVVQSEQLMLCGLSL